MPIACRYRALGGMTAWLATALWGALVLGAVAVGHWPLALVLAVIGGAVWSLDPSAVIELSPAGISRGFMLAGRYTRTPRVVAWSSVREILTRWQGPAGYTALATTVSDAEGNSLVFTTKMGLRAYRLLLRQVAAAAPEARQGGLTRQLLAEWSGTGAPRGPAGRMRGSLP